MGTTPDRDPGVGIEEGTIYEDEGIPASQAGEVRYASGAFSFYDSAGVYDPRAGGGGISEGQHEGLDTLTHGLVETSYDEVTRASGKITVYTTWTNSAKTLKVREVSVTRTGGKVTKVETKQYDGAGALKDTVTEDITRASGKFANLDRVNT